MGRGEPPRIAAVRIQPLWSSRRNPRVQCLEKLTGPLSEAELLEMERFPEFSVSGDHVSFSCRPEETEVSEQRLAVAVADSTTQSPADKRRRGLRAIS